MRSWLRSTAALLLILLVATFFLAVLYRPANLGPIPEAPRVTINLALTHDGIDPDRIEVLQGSRVLLNITADERAHRFGIPGYGLIRDIPLGGNLSLSFLATSQGSYEYKCMVILPDHALEHGVLVVLPTPPGSALEEPAMSADPRPLAGGTPTTDEESGNLSRAMTVATDAGPRAMLTRGRDSASGVEEFLVVWMKG